MRLWRLKRLDPPNWVEFSQSTNFDEVIVAAETEEDAKDIIPTTSDKSERPDSWVDGELWHFNFDRETFAYQKAEYAEWPLKRSHVIAELIGEAVPGISRGIVLASYK